MLNQYRLVKSLQEGPQGKVATAVDVKSSNFVAIKMYQMSGHGPQVSLWNI